MGLRDRLERKLTDAATRVADKGINAINSTIDAGARIKALADDPDQKMTIETLVLVFVETVRTENDGDRPKTRDEVKAAYAKRQKVIAWLSKAGPLGAATGSLAGLYNDAGILCNVADAHRLNLPPHELAAHVLVLWQVMPTHERALAAMNGVEGQSVADYLKARWPGGDQAENPDQMSKRQVVVLLWKLRSRRKAKVRKVDNQVEAMIQDAEEQLGVVARPNAAGGVFGKLTDGLKGHSSQRTHDDAKFAGINASLQAPHQEADAPRVSVPAQPERQLPGRWTAEDYGVHLRTLIAQKFEDSSHLWEWAERQGDLVPGEALFEAVETLRAELDDRAKGGWESRGSRFQRARSVLDSVPAASAVFLPLGEQLYDAGELRGPYTDVVDEVDFVRDGLMNYDPGPRRLDRLITLTLVAENIDHPRAAEWRTAAEEAVASLASVRLGAPVHKSIARLRLRGEQAKQPMRSLMLKRRGKDPSEQVAAAIAVLRQQQQENNVRDVGLMNMPKHKRAKDDLARLGADAVPALLQVLTTPRTPAAEAPEDYIENAVANDIAEVLGAIGDARAVEPLMACFKQYIVAAPRALAQFPAGVDALLRALDDPDDFIRSTSVDGLAFSPDDRAVLALAGALRDRSPSVRRSAAHAALIRGTATQEVVAEIGRMAREDPDQRVQKMADNAFRKLGRG